MAAENKIEKHLVAMIHNLGGHTRKLRFIERRGAPDRLCWIPGWDFPKLAELKAPGRRLGDHQKREHKKLKRMGFYVCKIDSFDDVDRFLRTK